MPVFEQVLETYPQQVKVVFKQFPLRNHNYAMKAAQATLAAHQQGKFWEFHDQLFEKHNQLSDQTVEAIRERLALDAERFNTAMQAPETMARIKGDLRDGSKAGVRGTPTVFVNGKLLRDKSFRGMKQAIEEAIRRLPVKG